MLIVTGARPFTPYEWCTRQSVLPGDSVLMNDADGGHTAFTIESIDTTAKRVHYSLVGVWRNREWIAMDPRAEYILARRQTEGE